MKQSLIGVQHSSGQMIQANILAGSHILVQGIFQSTTAASQWLKDCLPNMCTAMIIFIRWLKDRSSRPSIEV